MLTEAELDWRDAAEFEARVACKVATGGWEAMEEDYPRNASFYAIRSHCHGPAAYKLWLARVAVEEEMENAAT